MASQTIAKQKQIQQKYKLPKRFWEDSRWAHEHFGELQKKYLEKWVAIVNKKVAGVGEDGDIARRIARRKTGIKEIPVVFVESGQNIY